MIPFINNLGMENGEMIAIYFVIGLLSLIYLLRSVVFPYLNNGRPPASLKSLASFEIDEVLNYDQNYCSFKGFFYGDTSKPALLSIRQSAVNPEELATQAKCMSLSAKPRKGAIFGYYSGQFVSKYFSITGLLGLAMSSNNDSTSKKNKDNKRNNKKDMNWPWNVQVIYPWNIPNKSNEECESLFNKHYQKMKPKKMKFVYETKDIYDKVTLPMIESIPETHTYWITEIFDGKKEVNSTVLKNEHCVMVVDPKWNGHINVDDHPDQSQWKELMSKEKILRHMYLLCLAADDLKWRSLRDLDGERDLIILKSIRDECAKSVKKIYDVDMFNDCRVFVHYLPQYYHFHIHITGLNMIFGQSMCAGRAYLLDDVIQNLSVDPLYYQKYKLACMVPVNSDIYLASINDNNSINSDEIKEEEDTADN